MVDIYPKWNTFILVPIITTFIDKCLETIYKYNEPNSFYVYIVDQTVKGLDSTVLRDKYKNLMIIRTPKTNVHYTGTLGFSKANNLAIPLVTTPYFTMINDDIELLSSKWFQAVLDTFRMVNEATPDRPAVLVNPASTRLADWSIGAASGEDFDIIPYRPEGFTDEDWRHLTEDEHYINDRLTLKPNSVIDGVALYCSVFDTQKFLKVGYLDEHHFPSMGEDYCFSNMAYLKNFRCVGTTKSWVFHWWSSSTKAAQKDDEVKTLMIPELAWNNNNQEWGDSFDIWGQKAPCGEHMQTKDGITAICPKHPEETYKIPQPQIIPL
jgi:hypothetical protein